MKIIRWQRPGSNWHFGRLNNLREDLDRFFDAPLTEWARSSASQGSWAPPLDFYEDKDGFVATTELPGMKKEDIAVSLEDGVLSISGERKTEETSKDAEVYRSERTFGRFLRTVALPSAVAADKVKASYKDGVLTIHLPKTEEAKPKQIDVSVN